MEEKHFLKQMIELNKLAFNNTFNAMTMFQENMEKMAGAVLENSAWMPAEGKKAVDEWMKTNKKGREDFKKIVEEGFDRMETFFNRPGFKTADE